MPFLGSKYAKIAFAAGAPPRTPLGELTALPRPPSWINGSGGTSQNTLGAEPPSAEWG